MQENFSPQRTCVCCRKKTDKAALRRIVFSFDKVLFDDEKKLEGRGAYICADCLGAGDKQLVKALSRAYKRQITAEDIGALRVK